MGSFLILSLRITDHCVRVVTLHADLVPFLLVGFIPLESYSMKMKNQIDQLKLAQ